VAVNLGSGAAPTAQAFEVFDFQLQTDRTSAGLTSSAAPATIAAVLNRAMCPLCRKFELASVQAGPVVVDQCGQCRGAWFDARGDELRVLLECGWERVPDALKQAGTVADPDRDTPADLLKAEPLLCPRCGSGMMSHWYGGEAKTFVVDACPLGHGVWLDAGELERAFRVQQEFARKRAELERSGAVDAALARAETGDWGPKSAFESRVWEFLAALLNAKMQR
jgi:Zn-finger nucleic acid-binding protein